MKKDLHSFGEMDFAAKNEDQKVEPELNGKTEEKNEQNEIPELNQRQAEWIVKKYGSMSKDQLETELFKAMLKQKQKGTLDESFIKKSIDALAPFLSAEQREKMQTVFDSASEKLKEKD